MNGRGWLRSTIVGFVAAVGVVSAPSPAWADAPGPTDYRTEVKAIDPVTDSFRIEIIGGDSFVLLDQLRTRLCQCHGQERVAQGLCRHRVDWAVGAGRVVRERRAASASAR